MRATMPFKITVILFINVVVKSTAWAQALPAGEGRDLVQAVCSACHSISRVSTGLGYTEKNWLALINSMVDLSANKNQQQQIVKYLAKNFPPNERKLPSLINGEHKIAFTEWIVPTLGQRSRDPVEAPNGDIWWTGQWGNLIGRIDVDSGKMKEYLLPQGTKPHSVTPDEKGNIWYMGNKNGTVGRLDPNTGDIKVFNMPLKEARDPHTGVFDRNGTLWFTLQHSNLIGRLNPQTGNIDLKELPTAKSKPYGIKVSSEGDIWVACNGSNCLIKVDPETMAIEEIKLPHKSTKVRRLDIAEDGTIWYVNSARGRLGQYNPQNGKIREWPSPSGESSHPYAIAIVNGAVWYNESGMRPDALVRFDPTNETFQSWAVPSGEFYAGIVRHMRLTKNGDLLIHQSSSNRIIRVAIDD